MLRSIPIQLYCVAADGLREVPLHCEAQQVHSVMDEMETGVYTGMRTFHGNQFLGLAEHLDRLEDSMGQMGFPLALPRAAVRKALSEVVVPAQDEAHDSFIRIDVLPPGASYPGAESNLLITRGPLALVPKLFQEEGVHIGIAKGLQRSSPSIKSSDFVLARRPYPIGSLEAYEHLLVDPEGYLLEATSSNFYGLLNEELRTASSGILSGITRRFLLFLCAGLEYHVNTSAIHRDQLSSLDEAFLTSATRGIVPVVSVDGIPIGDGLPGPRTKALMRSYAVLCQRSPQPAWPCAKP